MGQTGPSEAHLEKTSDQWAKHARPRHVQGPPEARLRHVRGMVLHSITNKKNNYYLYMNNANKLEIINHVMKYYNNHIKTPKAYALRGGDFIMLRREMRKDGATKEKVLEYIDQIVYNRKKNYAKHIMFPYNVGPRNIYEQRIKKTFGFATPNLNIEALLDDIKKNVTGENAVNIFQKNVASFHDALCTNSTMLFRNIPQTNSISVSNLNRKTFNDTAQLKVIQDLVVYVNINTVSLIQVQPGKYLQFMQKEPNFKDNKIQVNSRYRYLLEQKVLTNAQHAFYLLHNTPSYKHAMALILNFEQKHVDIFQPHFKHVFGNNAAAATYHEGIVNGVHNFIQKQLPTIYSPNTWTVNVIYGKQPNNSRRCTAHAKTYVKNRIKIGSKTEPRSNNETVPHENELRKARNITNKLINQRLPVSSYGVRRALGS